MMGLERAAELLGGQEKLARVLGISSRQLRKKISAEAPISDLDVRLTVDALTRRAELMGELAARMSALIVRETA
ncbi:helix-turn-helix domain-containing protein [Sphingomonas abietis]|uniref:DNA binding HTH domain-containing protein n=1 Tax=Sphingomonas abietis TaxID=3012344 RepID=A0ABY7NRE8_9SPHN|nr:hypothetical protein [Sphingomonas abietis]WBO23958.1 hypothetical protein PBT88_07565 [Sphingomonas abietis]